MSAASGPPGEPFTVGGFEKVFDPGTDAAGRSWHVNDHCFARDSEGTWHLFGIVWPDPGHEPPAAVGLGHATAPRLGGPWTRQPYAVELDAARGETVLWAPHVVHQAGIYHMFYCSGGPDPTDWGISLALSSDLRTWTRHPGPLFRGGYQARDPMVMWNEPRRRWVMYYCATERPDGGRHVVAYRVSEDLRSWSEPGVAYADAWSGTEYGPTESPFVLRRGGYYYLLIGPRPYDPPTPDRPNWEHPGYDGTEVFRSRDWRRWEASDLVGYIPAHAAELVRDEAGRWYVSHCGIGRGGLFLAGLSWRDGQDEGDTSFPPPAAPSTPAGEG